MTIENLIERAKLASESAYCPYSQFKVGAAVDTEKGIFDGCNIENASYGLTMCAERNAIFAAIAAGATKIKAVAIYTPTPKPTAPCGACRLVIREFADDDILIHLISDGRVDDLISLGDLLPMSFGPESLL